MKTQLAKLIPVVLFAPILLVCCDKDEIKLTPLSSLTLVNVVNSGQPVRIGSNRLIVSNNNNGQFSFRAGNNNLYIWPVTDSLHPYYNQPLSTGSGEIYSIFLSGDTTAVDGVVVKDNIPYRQDSSFGVRFINLSSGSSPVKINLMDSPGISEFGNLSYKQISDFKSFPALAASTGFTFEVRLVTTDSLLTSTEISSNNIPRFRNITLVYRGASEGPVGITRVNNY